jgi:hypothetical protein
MYIPKTPLAQQKSVADHIPLPDPLAGKFPHTTLGGKIGSDGILYRQSATFTGGSWPLENGKIVPWSRVDWSSHGRPLVSPNPHQHIFNQSSFGTLENVWLNSPMLCIGKLGAFDLNTSSALLRGSLFSITEFGNLVKPCHFLKKYYNYGRRFRIFITNRVNGNDY